MCLKMPWRALVCAILTIICAPLVAAPLLNGISVHQELGNEQFIGAIYSETLSDNAQTLISSPVAKRMELKILAPEGIPVRRFSRMWIEGMAINNSSNLLTAQADNMVKFDSFFKGRLAQNDHVVFELTNGEGVNVSVNQILLGTVSNDEFFQLLLSTWIGRVPLSSTFRDDLLKLGDVPSSLRDRYNNIKFNPERSREIAAWGTPPVEAAPVITSSSSSAPQLAAVASSAPAIAAPRVELPALAQTVPNQPVPASGQATSFATIDFSASSSSSSSVIPDEDDDDDAQPTLTAQSLLARQFYVSDMLKKIRSNVRYPRRAQDRNQQGNVRIAISINRAGDIINMAWIEDTRFDMLNKEAWEAVKRAAPFPPIPDAINVPVFEFSAPITFELQQQ